MEHLCILGIELSVFFISVTLKDLQTVLKGR